ncbi:hypothetical protein DVH24_013352 [Malus domestica]|uniref:ATP-dependent RNA helicase SUV3 DEXQ-box helicase domain-containing protein n=1 Tax=Malus domestica TaxID=3750 RepID=A0A498HGL1_MALDO|nr:hypothetical protein DVH24_013352 [Malus domestica]
MKPFDLGDLIMPSSSPHTWYPKARSKQRKVILHMGPINSGKTYNALKQLESSSSGMFCYDNANTSVNIVRSFSFSARIYCGPLRLLAWEVAKQLNKAKVPCDLITGQERD